MQQTGKLSLISNRLVLKTLQVEDAEKVLNFCLENRQYFTPWEPLRIDEYFSIAYQQNLLETEYYEMLKGRLLRLYAFEKSDIQHEVIIGSVCLNNIVQGPFQSCFLSYKIAEKFTGNGYVTEAVETVVNYAFNELQLHRVEANIMPRNTASLKVVEKLGFEYEGTAKKYLQINGIWEDHLHMVKRNKALEQI